MSDDADDRKLLERMGGECCRGLARWGGMALLLADTMAWAARGLFTRKVRFGLPALAGQIVRVGARSLSIIIMVQLFIGVILALQMAPPLKPYGQQYQIPWLIGIAGFRMLGPIITAVVLTGFAGASIAAELGTMVVSEEIDALKAMAIHPIRFLVVPRVLATTVMMVVLTIVGDVMIATGGWVISRLALGPEVYAAYWSGMRERMDYRDLWTGLILAGVFGLLIGVIACFEGLRVRGGAEGVGHAATMTVVYSIVAIVLSAAVFSGIFYVYEL